VQGTATGPTTGLGTTTAGAGGVVQDAVGSVATAARTAAPRELQVSELPTMQLPVVAPRTSATPSPTPRATAEPPTTLLTAVPRSTDLARSIDPPTIPLPTVTPERRASAAAQTEGSRDDSSSADSSPTDSAGTDSAGTDSAGTDSAGTDSAGTDGAGTDGDERDSSRDTDDDSASASEAPGQSRAPLTGTLSSVTGSLLGR
jgi:hypothetical protein